MVTAKKLATRADLERLPANVVGEIIGGVLYTQPRPRARHGKAEGLITTDLTGPFERGRGGPGGWWIIPEPGIELPEAAEIVPDVAGWKKERMPELPDGPLTVVPDWVCEIFSPSTRHVDERVKRPLYARVGVRWLWTVDLEARTLLAYRNEGGHWLEVANVGDEDRARVEPFDAVELALGDWWSTPPPQP